MTYEIDGERLRSRFWGRVDKKGLDECWKWDGAVSAQGYGRISIGGRGGGMHQAHRVAYQLERGKIPPGLSILHSCDNRLCVNPHHLRTGTHGENMQDMAVRERTNTTKLNAGQVAAIRLLHASGVSQRTLAKRFGVRHGNIQAITSRKTWKHLP